GTLMSLVGGLTGRWLRLAAVQRARSGRPGWGRRLLGSLGGLVVGAIAGAAVGGALAHAPTDMVRLAGSSLVGLVGGAGLGGRRAWLIMLGCGLAGYLIGGEIGKRGISIEGLELQLSADKVAVIGFSIVGAVVGAVLGADRRDSGAVKKEEPEVKV